MIDGERGLSVRTIQHFVKVTGDRPVQMATEFMMISVSQVWNSSRGNALSARSHDSLGNRGIRTGSYICQPPWGPFPLVLPATRHFRPIISRCLSAEDIPDIATSEAFTGSLNWFDCPIWFVRILPSGMQRRLLPKSMHMTVRWQLRISGRILEIGSVVSATFLIAPVRSQFASDRDAQW